MDSFVKIDHVYLFLPPTGSVVAVCHEFAVNFDFNLESTEWSTYPKYIQNYLLPKYIIVEWKGGACSVNMQYC